MDGDPSQGVGAREGYLNETWVTIIQNVKSFRNIPLPSISLTSTSSSTATVPAVPVTVAVVASLGVCLPFGSTWVMTGLTARLPWLVAPSTLGAPFGLPRLRVTPFGEQSWDALAVEVIAAAVLAATTGTWARRALKHRSAPGAVRCGLSAWTGFVLGATIANTLRAIGATTPMGFGLVGYGVIVIVGMLSGVCWGILLGWIPGLATGVAVRRGRPRSTAPTPPPTNPTA